MSKKNSRSTTGIEAAGVAGASLPPALAAGFYFLRRRPGEVERRTLESARLVKGLTHPSPGVIDPFLGAVNKFAAKKGEPPKVDPYRPHKFAAIGSALTSAPFAVAMGFNLNDTAKLQREMDFKEAKAILRDGRYLGHVYESGAPKAVRLAGLLKNAFWDELAKIASRGERLNEAVEQFIEHSPFVMGGGTAVAGAGAVLHRKKGKEKRANLSGAYLQRKGVEKVAFLHGDPGAVDMAKQRMSQVFVQLIALQMLSWDGHWKAKGPSQQGDHQLFERIYNDVRWKIDSLAEKMVAYFGEQAFSICELMGAAAQKLQESEASGEDHFLRTMSLEDELQEILRQSHDELLKSGVMPLGLDDWIMGTAREFESHSYLLQQRAGEHDPNTAHPAAADPAAMGGAPPEGMPPEMGGGGAPPPGDPGMGAPPPEGMPPAGMGGGAGPQTPSVMAGLLGAAGGPLAGPPGAGAPPKKPAGPASGGAKKPEPKKEPGKSPEKPKGEEKEKAAAFLRRISHTKVACSDMKEGEKPVPWSDRFKNTPFHQEAIELDAQQAKRDLAEDAEDLRRDFHRIQGSALRIKKHALEYKLKEHQLHQKS